MSTLDRSERCPTCGKPIPAGARRNLCPACLLGLAAVPAAPESPGPARRYIGDYELGKLLGEGGMGKVYAATQITIKRPAAVKLLQNEHFASARQVERFRLEAEAAARLRHPNIVEVFEVGEHEGQPFFSMRLVQGRSLDKQIDAGQWRSPEAESGLRRKGRERNIARLMIRLARAIHHAHQRGVLHRDLKPANILMDENDEPHITDFGLAKLLEQDSGISQSGVLVGTPCYMAPEQIAGKGVDISTAVDVYALGAVFYELLTGQRVFEGATLIETLAQIAHQDPRPPRDLSPALDRSLEAVCLKCLEKDPARRYGSAGDLADDLERWLNREPVKARSAGPLTRAVQWSWKTVRRHPTLSTLVVVLAIAGWVITAAQRQSAADRKASVKHEKQYRSSFEVIQKILPSLISDIGLLEQGESAADEIAKVINDLEDDSDLKVLLLFYLGHFAEQQDDLSQARAHWGKGLGIVASRFGTTNRTAVQFRTSLADVTLRTRDPRAAESHLREILNVVPQLKPEAGDDPDSVSESHLYLGVALQEQGRFDEAMASFQTGLRLIQARTNHTRFDLQWPLLLTARLAYARKDIAAAEAHAKQALDHGSKVDANAAYCRMLLGSCLVERGELAEGERLLEHGCTELLEKSEFTLLKELLIPEAIQRIGRFYIKTNRPEPAAQWQQRLKEAGLDKSTAPNAPSRAGTPPQQATAP